MTVMTKSQTEIEAGIWSWDMRLAYWVSQIGSPPMLGLVAALLVAGTLATSAAWKWAGIYVAMTILAPCIYIIWLVRRGAASDFHLSQREQRMRPLLLTSVMGVAAWALCTRYAAPPPFQLLASANGMQMALIFLITLRWKISLHSATAAGLCILSLLLLGIIAAPMLMSVPLIAWARVRLQRHTISQTIAGAFLGMALLWVALLAYPPG